MSTNCEAEHTSYHRNAIHAVPTFTYITAMLLNTVPGTPENSGTSEDTDTTENTQPRLTHPRVLPWEKQHTVKADRGRDAL